MPNGAATVGRLDRLRSWQRWLDEAFLVPGTRIRFGWDAILGLLPWAGDVVAAAFGLVILFHARQMRVPGVVLARMTINLAVDLVVGLIPFAGDVADVFWKANSRNLALIERHTQEAQAPTTGDWVFLVGVAAAFLGLAALPFFLFVGLVRLLGLW
jgi:Domain of unknown function (DUF4112)